MKKNIIIFILVLVIIVEYFILIINKGKMYQIKNEMQVTIDNLNTKIEYLKTKQINPEIKNINNIKETIILHDDLNLQISNFLLNSENKSISMDMFFSSNNKDIQSVTYNLLIYDKNINIIELEDFYFTDKVFKAIKSFAKKLSLDAIVEINNKKWNKFYL